MHHVQKGQVAIRPRARKIPSIIRLGERISKADMPAGALLFPRIAPPPRTRGSPLSLSLSLSLWLRSPTRQWDPSSLLAAEQSISKSTRRLCGEPETEQARQRRAREARDRPAGDRIDRASRMAPAAGAADWPALARDHVNQGPRSR
jgi:hypothetical protein